MQGATLAILLVAAAVGCSRSDPANTTPAPIEVVKPTAAAPFDRTFAWRPVRGATSYRVVVFNSEGSRSFEVRDIRTTSIAVAASVVLPAARYSWQVLAFRDDQQFSESAITPFEIK